MRTYAAEIAARLQRAGQREDTKMGKGPNHDEQDNDPFVRALNLSAELGKVLGDIAASGHAPDENAGRVAELERQLAGAHRAYQTLAHHCDGLVAQRDEARAGAALLEAELGGALTLFVQREVPWTDVAAGMMTIARDGTPWMVAAWLGAPDAGKVRLQQGGLTFDKTPADGETVRVLVPYVTPEQAKSLVKGELGGTAVS